MTTTYDTDNVLTESDVEQKIVAPLLTFPIPAGLGFSSTNIKTKPNIRRLTIGKGKEQKLYFPDYVIVVAGLPVMVIEVKAPGEGLDDAYREARLYATELNSQFPASVNPVTIIVCTNGNEIWAGRWDTSTPKIVVRKEGFSPSNLDFAALVDFARFDEAETAAAGMLEKMTRRPFTKPTRLLGGTSVRNEELGHNGFGATLQLDFRHVFNPATDEERAYIVKNAYITSERRTRYVAPIDRMIRAAAPPSVSSTTLIENTKRPNVIIDTLRKGKALENQVLLLIGGVGSGKSTFVDYLREVALPRDVMDKTTWLRINMNYAPINTERVYDWLCDELVRSVRELHNNIDFESLASLERIYWVEIGSFKKGPLQLLPENSMEYKSALFAELVRLQQDKEATAKAYLRHMCVEREKLPIIVLDNCDKRIRDEQLMMFQAAQWMQQTFRALILLPLRDETFDNHRHMPPLDTAVKDLQFRIEPPRFQDVLSRRVTLALREMQGPKRLSYLLPNDIRVDYPATEQGYYLSSILKSIFEYDAFIRRMIVGLAGRDLRRAMEIFLEFCTSGHIGEDQIFKIVQSEGKYILPFATVSRVLLRGNRRFYDSDSSWVKNVFACVVEDPNPSYFIRYAILKWLDKRYSQKGPTGARGYHSVANMLSDLNQIGAPEKCIVRELVYLLKAHCVLAEHLRTDTVELEDLIRLAPAGSVHLDILFETTYWAAIAEDTWFDSAEMAGLVSRRIARKEAHFSENATARNAHMMGDYIRVKRSQPFPAPELYLDNPEWKYLVDIDRFVDAIERDYVQHKRQDAWFDIEERYKPGLVFVAVASVNHDIGVFAELEAGVTGLAHWNDIGRARYDEVKSLHSRLAKFEVLRVDGEEHRIALQVIGPA